MAKLISLGDIIDKTWDHYTEHFKMLMKISLWALLIPVFMIFRILILPNQEMESLAFFIDGNYDLYLLFAIIFGIFISLIATPAITVWIYIMLIKATDLQDQGEQVSEKAMRIFGLNNFFSYVLVALLKTLVMATGILPIIPGLILTFYNIFYDGGAISGALTAIILLLGILVSLVMFVALGVMMGFFEFERLIGNKRGFSAISGSYKLVKGRFWHTLFLLYVPKIIIVFTFAVLNLIPIMIAIPINSEIVSLGVVPTAILTILYLLAQTVILIITTPIFIIAEYKLYDSLRKTQQ